MKKLTSRRLAGVTLIATLAAIWSLTAAPALADATKVETNPGPGAVCPQDHRDPGTSASGPWGSADSDSTGVDVEVNAGYEVFICVKAGPGYEIWKVTAPGGFVPSVDGKTLSHWSLRVEQLPPPPTTTTTEPPTTTTEPPTTTTEAPTTTTEAPTTTTTEPEVSSTSTSSTTSTTEPEVTTTTEGDDDEPEVAPTTVTSTTVQTDDTEEETEDTLPFTGVDSDHMALVALVALAAGSGLVLLTGKSDESKGVHRA